MELLFEKSVDQEQEIHKLFFTSSSAQQVETIVEQKYQPFIK